MVPPLSFLDMVNFGLALVIWLVQVIIYPGFSHYQEDRLVVWHARYTQLISIFVVPLMLVQIGWLAADVYAGGGPAANGMFLMVLMCWGVTFKFSVALHRKIAAGRQVASSVRLLILTNWPRTILWSAVFLVGLFLD